MIRMYFLLVVMVVASGIVSYPKQAAADQYAWEMFTIGGAPLIESGSAGNPSKWSYESPEHACDIGDIGFYDFDGKTRPATWNGALPRDLECLTTNGWRAAVSFCDPDGPGGLPGKRGYCETPPAGCSIQENADPSATGQGTVGNPVQIGTGLKIERTVDWESPREPRFRFTRFFRSAPDQFGMGVGWRSNWSLRLYLGSDLAFALRADGSLVKFVKAGSIWSGARGDASLTLADVGSQWEVRDGSGRVETYGADGLLSAVSWADGYQIAVTRNTDGTIAILGDNRGQSAAFTTAQIANPGPKVTTRIDIDHDTSAPGAANSLVRLDYGYGTGTTSYTYTLGGTAHTGEHSTTWLETVALSGISVDTSTNAETTTGSETIAAYTYTATSG